MIAMNLRREVHRMVLEGTSNDEIKQFMFERYGDFILYRPRLMPSTSCCGLPGVDLVMGLWVWIKMGKLTRVRADIPSGGNDLSDNEATALLSSEDIAEVERLLEMLNREHDRDRDDPDDWHCCCQRCVGGNGSP